MPGFVPAAQEGKKVQRAGYRWGQRKMSEDPEAEFWVIGGPRDRFWQPAAGLGIAGDTWASFGIFAGLGACFGQV